MVRLKGPLFSLEASKQLGKTIIYKTKSGRSFATRYNFPGSKNPFTPSASQVENREFYGEAVELWQAMSQEEQDVWNDLAKNKNLQMSGWNLFYKTEFENPTAVSFDSIYGDRFLGKFTYGNT